ncbi:hypothetical protein [Streptomyces sp. NPDC005125]
MTGRRPGSIRRSQGDLRRGRPGYAVPAAPLVVAVGSGCTPESSRAAGPPQAGRTPPPGGPARPATCQHLPHLPRSWTWSDGTAICAPATSPSRTCGAPRTGTAAASLTAMIRSGMKTITAVMKTITAKGYAVARPEDYV